MVILIVDDDPVSLLLAEHILRAGGHDVSTAVNAAAAEVSINEAPEPIDVVVCDYMMPETNGLDLLERLRSRDDLTAPPFVLLTGVSEAADLDDERVGLAAAYLTKPVQSDELLAVVERVGAAE